MQMYDAPGTDASSVGGGGGGGRANHAGNASKQPAAPPASAPATSPPAPLAEAFVDRVIEHAMGVDQKISQLNASWPQIVATYHERVRADVADRALFLRRYEAATRGDAEGTTLAMLEPISLSAGPRSG